MRRRQLPPIPTLRQIENRDKNLNFKETECKTSELCLEPRDKFVTFRPRRDKQPVQFIENTKGNSTVDMHCQTENSTSSKRLMIKPATYDGTGCWTDYKAHFDVCAKLNDWIDLEKGMYLAVSLRGQAQGVFGNLTKSNDYSELIND